MKIAHFSDWHFPEDPEEFEGTFGLFQEHVATAVEEGAGHVVITGDMVERADVGAYSRIIQALAKQGFKGAAKLSIVPGNHDIHPVSAENLLASAGDCLKATKKQAQFNQMVSRTVTASQQILPNTPFPFVKKLDGGGALLVGLNTVHEKTFGFTLSIRDTLAKSARGRFVEDAEEVLHSLLNQPAYLQPPVRILVMHHYPVEGVMFDDINGDFEDEDLQRIRSFIKDFQFDFVLCGHWHDWHVCKLGKSRIINSAVQEDDYGFHLLDTDTKKVRWVG